MVPQGLEIQEYLWKIYFNSVYEFVFMSEGAHRGQQRVSALESQAVVVPPDGGDESWTLVFWKSNIHSQPTRHLPNPS